MRLLADLHTHTVASGHGFSTMTENVRAARLGGLELIAITDHGPSVPEGAHPWYFWNLKEAPSVLDGVRILKGCEANISATSGSGIDIPDEVLEYLDFVMVGFHPLTGFDEGDRDRNTEALVRAMNNPFVDQVSHPGNEQFPVDLDIIVSAASANRVILELNNHSFSETSSRGVSSYREVEFAEAAHAAGAPISLGSDAHYALHVGRFDAALAVAEQIGLTPDDFVNKDAASVLSFLGAKRERPHLDSGGEWSWQDAGGSEEGAP